MTLHPQFAVHAVLVSTRNLVTQIVVRKQILGTAALTLLLTVPTLPQLIQTANAPQLSAHEIVSKMDAMNGKRAADLKSYTSARVYELDYRGFPARKHATMIVNVRFQSPQKKELVIASEEGSGLLRNRVLRKLIESESEASGKDNQNATALTEANYEFKLAGQERKDGRFCYVLEVKPKTKSKFVYVGKIWVDIEDFAVVHISAQPAKNPSFWIKRVEIEHQYKKFGELWLPIRNQSTSSIRIGGQATLTIDYGKYTVEAGQPPTSALSTAIGQQQ